MEALFVIGRVLFGGYFLFNGFNHFLQLRGMSEYAKMKGVPMPTGAVAVTGILLVAGGMCMLLGIRIRTGVVLIATFLIPVTIMMHAFWKVQDPQMRMAEMVNFMKNMALLGATLMLPAIPRPWVFSFGF